MRNALKREPLHADAITLSLTMNIQQQRATGCTVLLLALLGFWTVVAWILNLL
jgi:hypothetical protein